MDFQNLTKELWTIQRSSVMFSLSIQIIGTLSSDSPVYLVASKKMILLIRRTFLPVERIHSVGWYDILFSKSEGQKTAGRSLADLLFELPIPCMACSEKLADARFMPCRHKVLCLQCCFRVDECPVCDADIEQRVDMRK